MRKVLQFCRISPGIVNFLAPFTFENARDAVIKNDLAALDKILSNYIGELADEENLLLVALAQAREETVLFIAQHFDYLLNYQRRNDQGDTPLMVAIFRKMPTIIQILLPFSQLNACDFHKNTPFIAAAANGDITTLELLLNDKRCNPLAKNQDGHTALHRACYYGEIKTAEWLLNQGVGFKVGEKDIRGNNCLHLACSTAKIAMARYLYHKVKDAFELLHANQQDQTPYQILRESLSKIGNAYGEKELNIQFLKSKCQS